MSLRDEIIDNLIAALPYSKRTSFYRESVEAAILQNAPLMAVLVEVEAACAEINRLMLVVESAVRYSDPAHQPATLAALKANRTALAKLRELRG